MTVIISEYGTRLDSQPAAQSGTVDEAPDFVNLYQHGREGRGGNLLPKRPEPCVEKSSHV